MESFFVGISLSAVGGLAWLSYHHPRFSIKLLGAILILAFLIQGGFFAWYSIWDESQDNY